MSQDGAVGGVGEFSGYHKSVREETCNRWSPLSPLGPNANLLRIYYILPLEGFCVQVPGKSPVDALFLRFGSHQKKSPSPLSP